MKKITTFIFTFSINAFTATGFLDFNYYYDSRDFNVLTINAFAKINERLQYFSLTNYDNSVGSNDNLDKTNFLTEQNIRYKLATSSAFDLVSQSFIQSSTDNDKLRLGVRFRPMTYEKIKSWFLGRFNYFVTVFPIQIDSLPGTNWQIEHVYRILIIKDVLFLSGFLDHNILETGNKIVSEHQLAWRFYGQLHLVSEYRINEFLTNDRYGWGYGLEYKILF